MQKKPKQKLKSWYVKKLDRVFSKNISKKKAKTFGMTRCYTCDKTAHWKDLQNGHYISRGHMATRWLEENCRVQCSGCNIFKRGNYTEYAYRLLKEIGREGLDALREKKKEIKQWSIQDLKTEIQKYEGT